jgi:phosphopantothenate-cysteine ligase/phosphopantothenoylcysteine decarboxylase/phosphopantothenate--cysteine ligase
MRILVTTGNTQTPLDAVRCITNIFTGRTGTRIALEADRRGHAVVLATSHPELCGQLGQPSHRLTVRAYRTFDDLHALLVELLDSRQLPRFDAIVHAAAVSDYAVRGVYTVAGTASPRGRPETSEPAASASLPAELKPLDGSDSKLPSGLPELWLRLTPTLKLVDLFRSPWGFDGILVKFKLEAGVDDAVLLERAERSRIQSGADLMVANTLQGMASWAMLGPVPGGPLPGGYERVERSLLAGRLLEQIEARVAP